MYFTLKEWADATGGEILAGIPSMYVGGKRPGGLSIDSRTISEGDWFIALMGKTGSDGHRWLENAVGKGAGGIIVSNREEYEIKVGNSYPDLPALMVKDTTIAMGDAAKSILKNFNPFVIAITGTVGKTSVKENIAHIASIKWPTLKTLFNWNTEIGVPLTIFEITSDHKVAVIECASRGKGQISYLSEIVQPDVAVITAIGPGHLSEFGSVDDVAEAKWEIVDGLKEDGVVVVNDNPDEGGKYTGKYKGNYRLVTFGNEIQSEVTSLKTVYGIRSTTFELGIREDTWHTAEIPGTSWGDVMNALCAVSVSLQIAVSDNGDEEFLAEDEIVTALKDLPSTPGRMEYFVRPSGIEVIFDAYNSNPMSLKNAIYTLMHTMNLSDGSDVKRHVAILGDMLELGDEAEMYHREIGEIYAWHLLKNGILITVGKSGSIILDTAKKTLKKIELDHGIEREDSRTCGMQYETTEDCSKDLVNILDPGDLVLIKASRSLHFEKLLEENW